MLHAPGAGPSDGELLSRLEPAHPAAAAASSAAPMITMLIVPGRWPLNPSAQGEKTSQTPSTALTTSCQCFKGFMSLPPAPTPSDAKLLTGSASAEFLVPF
jgi:hypothetical protein